MATTMSALQKTLDLRQIAGCDIFVGSEEAVGRTRWGNVFGGQVLAQALVAAQRTVPKRFDTHSLHCYFLLAGETGVEILYEVERVRDGKSFATRVVKAIQRNKPIFQISVSFHAPEWGPSFQTPGRELRMIAVARGIEKFSSPEELLSQGVELEHIVGADNQGEIDTLLVQRGAWWSMRYFRHRSPLPDDFGIHASVFAWMSDATMVDTVLLPHQAGVKLPGRTGYTFDMCFTLDHSIHFHQPFRSDEWLLFHERTTVSSGGRGLSRNEVFTLDGNLVATVTQEALVRVPKGLAQENASLLANARLAARL